MRRNSGLIGVEGLISENKTGIFDTFDVYNNRKKNTWPTEVASNITSITANKTSINEGESVTFSITTTTNFKNGTIFYVVEEVTGLITDTDFEEPRSGEIQITNRQGTLTLTASEDTFDEGEESFKVNFRFEEEGNISAISNVITINDTSTGGGEEPAGIYDFTTATFTNGGQSGRLGPSLTQARSGLSGPEVDTWKNDTEFFNTSNGIQLWTVPATGLYRIEAWGAGSNFFSNQRGARMRGDFELTEGEVIHILAGQTGDPARTEAGSGGTFVVREPYNTLSSCILAAGGSGGYWSLNDSRMQGTTASNGQDSVNSTGGSNGGGGGNQGVGGATNGGGGGGFIGNGAGNVGSQSGFSFINGGVASTSGGFGGGGGIGSNRVGGGGGYSGGAGGGSGSFAGGGGSFNSGTNQSNTAGVRSGHGQVTITRL